MLKLGKHKVKLIFDTYKFGNGLYVGLEDENGEFFDDLTTNLLGAGYLANIDCGFVQEGSVWGNDYIKWLEKNGLAKRTGNVARSGFNTYAEMKFVLE